VRVDHGRRHIRVAERFLNPPDVRTGLEQAGGRRMAQGVAGNARCDTSPLRSTPDHLPAPSLLNVVASYDPRSWIGGEPVRREEPPPQPFGPGGRTLETGRPRNGGTGFHQADGTDPLMFPERASSGSGRSKPEPLRGSGWQWFPRFQSGQRVVRNARTTPQPSRTSPGPREYRGSASKRSLPWPRTSPGLVVPNAMASVQGCRSRAHVLSPYSDLYRRQDKCLMRTSA